MNMEIRIDDTLSSEQFTGVRELTTKYVSDLNSIIQEYANDLYHKKIAEFGGVPNYDLFVSEYNQLKERCENLSHIIKAQQTQYLEFMKSLFVLVKEYPKLKEAIIKEIVNKAYLDCALAFTQSKDVNWKNQFDKLVERHA